MELIAQYGNEKAKSKYNILPESDADSDPGIYSEVGSHIIVDDWVGVLNAELEIWELFDGCLKMRQRVVSLYYCSRCFSINFCRRFYPLRLNTKTLP